MNTSGTVLILSLTANAKLLPSRDTRQGVKEDEKLASFCRETQNITLNQAFGTLFSLFFP
jgi:hypothetical protein